MTDPRSEQPSLVSRPSGPGVDGTAAMLAQVGRGRSVAAYAWATVSVAGVTAIGVLVRPYIELSDVSMLYLLAIMVTAVWFGRGPSMTAALLSVAAFDLFFVAPLYTFAVDDPRYVLTFGFMLGLGLVISGLTERVRMQAAAARGREQRTAILYSLSRDLAQLRHSASIGVSAARHVAELTGGTVTVLLPGQGGELAPLPGTAGELLREPGERAAARHAFTGGSAVVAAGKLRYFPLTAAGRTIGVLGVAAPDPARLRGVALQELLAAMSGQVALALHRVQLADEAQQAELRAKTEELRAALLSSVSHDLRTPLTAISTAASVLLQRGPLADDKRLEFAGAIYDEALRLGRLVTNLLHMTRLESGGVPLRREWTPLEDPIGAAIGRLEQVLAGRAVEVTLAPDLPPVSIDEVLFEHLLLNLLENAAKYTPPGSPIEVRARIDGGALQLEVLDRGPGLPADHAGRLFAMFVQAGGPRRGGFGLGLAICRAIAAAHGGTIAAEDRPDGGAVFRVTLPYAPAAGPESDPTALGPE